VHSPGGSVWTTDPERGKAVARRVRTGTIGANKYIPDPAAPFGGVKRAASAANSAPKPSAPASSSSPYT